MDWKMTALLYGAAVLCGLFFGGWPPLMAKGGLHDAQTSALLVTANIMLVLPFAFYRQPNLISLFAASEPQAVATSILAATLDSVAKLALMWCLANAGTKTWIMIAIMVSLQITINFALKLWWASTWPNPLMLVGIIGFVLSILAVNLGWRQIETQSPALTAQQ